MGRTIARTMFAVWILVSACCAVDLSISSPANYSTVNSPAVIVASAAGTHPITGWHIYVDGFDSWSAGAGQRISAPLAMKPGARNVAVRAWDSTGAYATTILSLNVSAAPSSAVTVTVSAPANGAVLGSPFTFSAKAASGYPITGWRIYADGNPVYAAGATNAISAPVSLGAGTHYITARAWNSTGNYGSANLTVAVGSGPGSGAPVPPPHATVYTNLEDKPNGWQQCSGASCSGGIAVATSYWKAQHQTTPSLDGSSTEFFIDGPAYATNLFGLLIANNPASSHFLFDFGVYVDPVSHTAVQALEFDIYHVANGRKYMFGTECDYWSKTWDTWNEQTQRWIPTNAVCTPLSPGAWHRVQWAVERVGSQIHYLTVTVDGVTQRIADAYAYQPAMPSNWDNGNIGVQFQQDLNQSPGSGMHMWVDKVTVYAW